MGCQRAEKVWFLFIFSPLIQRHVCPGAVSGIAARSHLLELSRVAMPDVAYVQKWRCS